MSILSKLISKKLNNQLLFVISFLVFLPTLIINYLSYQGSKVELYNGAVEDLEMISDFRTGLLKRNFEELESDIKTQVSTLGINTELTAIVADYHQSGKNLDNYVYSEAWYQQTRKLRGTLTAIKDNNDYNDILLIDGSGNVLFSLSQEKVLGSNVFSDEKSNHHLLTKSAKKAIESQQFVFSDIDQHQEKYHQHAGFFLQPLFDEKEYLSGLYVVETETGVKDNLFTFFSNSQTKSYLIGTDLKKKCN